MSEDTEIRFRVVDDRKDRSDIVSESETCTLFGTTENDGFINSIKPFNADDSFDELFFKAEITETMNAIYHEIRKLHDFGIGSLVIQSIANKDSTISRMRIDDNNNITLPDYGNMTIEMAPMTKSVYLLFLRHKEGIMFKDLPDYRNELTAIYWDMIESDDEEKVISAIKRVTDPCNNAINEHCSRIKVAFTSKFDNRLAKNYYIYGQRGEAKKISLPRELVEWND